MKHALILIFTVLLGVSGFAANINEKVLKNFRETFTTAENVKWHEYKDYLSVNFTQFGIRTTVNYDRKGNMLGALRYYEPHMLPLNVLNQVKKEFPNQSLYGVTELSFGNEVNYYIKMQDDRNWITVKADPSGSNTVVEKYQKR